MALRSRGLVTLLLFAAAMVFVLGLSPTGSARLISDRDAGGFGGAACETGTRKNTPCTQTPECIQAAADDCIASCTLACTKTNTDDQRVIPTTNPATWTTGSVEGGCGKWNTTSICDVFERPGQANYCACSDPGAGTGSCIRLTAVPGCGGTGTP